MESRREPSKLSPEVNEPGVRAVLYHEHETDRSGQQSARSLGQHEDWLYGDLALLDDPAGQTLGPTPSDLDRIKQLEREDRELRRANEILRKVSA